MSERRKVVLSISGLKALQISKMVDHILRVPGNVRNGVPVGGTVRNVALAAGGGKGNHLEMTVAVVSTESTEVLKEDVKAVVDALKRSNEIFRNVRLNFVRPKKDGSFDNQVIPLIYLQTGKCFKEDTSNSPAPSLASLCAYLKKFHARSKVILVFADEGYAQIPGKTDNTKNIYETAESKTKESKAENELLREALNPFLKQKMLLIMGDEVVTGTQIFMNVIHNG